MHEGGYSAVTVDSRPNREADDSDMIYNKMFYTDVAGFGSAEKFRSFVERLREEMDEPNIKIMGIYPKGNPRASNLIPLPDKRL